MQLPKIINRHRYFNLTWLSRSDVNWAYVRINRAGSSFITSYLESNDFLLVDPIDFKKTHKLVILRDPLDRLLSGITFFGYGKQFIKNPKKFFTEYRFDLHVQNQTKFLEEVDLDNCTFIKYNNSLKENLLSFIAKTNTQMYIEPGEWTDRITPISYPDRKNEVEPDSISGIRFQIIDALKSNTMMNEIVTSYLEKDYELYNSVEFYGTN